MKTRLFSRNTTNTLSYKKSFGIPLFVVGILISTLGFSSVAEADSTSFGYPYISSNAQVYNPQQPGDAAGCNNVGYASFYGEVIHSNGDQNAVFNPGETVYVNLSWSDTGDPYGTQTSGSWTTDGSFSPGGYGSTGGSFTAPTTPGTYRVIFSGESSPTAGSCDPTTPNGSSLGWNASGDAVYFRVGTYVPSAPPTPNMCVASPNPADTANPTIWTATPASNLDGPFSYSWSSTDGLTGTSQSVSKTYSSAGTKTANVSITDQSTAQPAGYGYWYGQGGMACSGSATSYTTTTGDTSSWPADVHQNPQNYCIQDQTTTTEQTDYSQCQPVDFWSTDPAPNQHYGSDPYGGYYYCPTYTDTQTTSTLYNGSGTYNRGDANPSYTATTYHQGTPASSGTVSSASCNVSVTAPAPATATLTPSTSTVIAGQSQTLTFGSTNATSCAGTGFSTGGATSGNFTVSPSTSTTYSVTCTGNGSATATATVTVIPALGATCTASPNPVATSQATTFTATPSGGTGSYTYSWSFDDSTSGGSASSASKAFSTTGTHTAWVNVVSGTQNVTTSCTVGVPPPTGQPNLNATVGPAVSGTTGSSVALTGTVTNNGDAAASGTFPNVVQVCDGSCSAVNQLISATSLTSLAQGASQGVSATYTNANASATQYRVCADNNTSWAGNVTESNESDNCSAWQTLTVSTPLPDLTASAGSSASATTGGSVSLSGTITNIGAATASNFPNVVQVCDGSCSALNQLLSTNAIVSLAVNATQGVSATYTNASASATRYRVCANNDTNWTNWITESNYGNNCSAWQTVNVSTSPVNGVCGSANGAAVSSAPSSNLCSPGNASSVSGSGPWSWSCAGTNGGSTASCTAPVTPPATQPDLTAGAVSPTTATVGQSTSLSALATNIGNATSGSFPMLFQVAETAWLGNSSYLAGLAPNASNSGSASYTFPSVGTYTVRACANYNTSWVGITPESDFNNNCGPWTTINVTAAAQPVSGSCSASPSSIKAGDSTTWTALPSGGNGSYTYSWSGTDALSGSGSSIVATYYSAGTKTASVTITSNGQSATVACSNSVTVTAALPDLTTGLVSPTSVTVGQATSFSALVSNSGDASTGRSFTDLFQRATDASGTGATDIGTYANATLGAGLTTTATKSYTFASVGTYYMRVCADKSSAANNGVVSESNETNNCGAWTAITVSAAAAPDLTAGDISPTSATTNSPITLTSTVTNGGTGSTGASFTDLFQRATDASGSGAIDIGTYSSGALANGGNNTASLAYSLPGPSTWYVRACADKSSGGSSGVITESNESNNCGAWTAITVTDPTPPTITSCTPSPSTAAPNQSVTWTVTTSGFSPPPTTYFWIMKGAIPSSQSDGNSSFTASFDSAGAYSPSIDVTSDTQSAGPVSCTPVTISGTPASCSAGAVVSISANPTRVISGNSSTITYSVAGVGTACTLTGPGGPGTVTPDSSCNASASFSTGAVTSQSVYTLICPGATVQTAVVNVTPKFQEF